MESTVKKYYQKYRRVKEEMGKWDALQSRLISQFRNASSIIDRLQAIQESRNYGTLNRVGGIVDAVLRKQIESLQAILISMNKTLEDFRSIVMFLEKMHREGKQLVKSGGSNQLTTKQLQLRVGVKPCIADCLDGLLILHDMHKSECILKSSVLEALAAVIAKHSYRDLPALQQLLVDQPNIPKEEEDIT